MSILQFATVATKMPSKISLSSTSNWPITGAGTQASPFAGTNTNQGLVGTSAIATFFVAYGIAAPTLHWDISISLDPYFDQFRMDIYPDVNMYRRGVIREVGSALITNGGTLTCRYDNYANVNPTTDTVIINSLYLVPP